eukprot:6876411-Pyramimonas_sp.AAC.1
MSVAWLACYAQFVSASVSPRASATLRAASPLPMRLPRRTPAPSQAASPPADMPPPSYLRLVRWRLSRLTYRAFSAPSLRVHLILATVLSTARGRARRAASRAPRRPRRHGGDAAR